MLRDSGLEFGAWALGAWISGLRFGFICLITYLSLCFCVCVLSRLSFVVLLAWGSEWDEWDLRGPSGVHGAG